MLSKAIVKQPCRNMINGLTSANLGLPDYEKALVQHRQYVELLRQCGLEVTVLNGDENYPDSTFIEDTAVLIPGCAIITNPGAPSRRGEIEAVREFLRKIFSRIEQITAPGTLDGGDVLRVEDHFYIGLSGRTNRAGAEQLIEILQSGGLTGSTVSLKNVLHLKSGVSYLGKQNLVASGEFLSKSEFQKYHIIPVNNDEEYAANCIRVNDLVIIPAGFPKTGKAIIDAGYEVLECDVSEFRKLDGGLSCLSLRF